MLRLPQLRRSKCPTNQLNVTKILELYRIRHSAAHIMAEAVVEMFPGQAKVAIGPPIADGFYYDFDLPRALTPEDLQAIEKRMRQIIGRQVPVSAPGGQRGAGAASSSRTSPTSWS